MSRIFVKQFVLYTGISLQILCCINAFTTYSLVPFIHSGISTGHKNQQAVVEAVVPSCLIKYNLTGPGASQEAGTFTRGLWGDLERGGGGYDVRTCT